jgi:hypothetical protein
MSCYDEYDDDKIKRAKLIKKGMYLLNAKCCNKDCDKLVEDIENTANECNNLFRHMTHKSNLDEEGKIISGSLCSELQEKKNNVLHYVSSKLKGGMVKKNKRKKSKKKKSRFRKVQNRGTVKRRIKN